ncbi:hypothetical protein Tco_1576848 [Tanacetum coccineum]
MSARTSILVNGSPTSKFSLRRGLRQGDPLSPFFFIIVMEGLRMALNDALVANMFHGVTLGGHGYTKKIVWVKWSNILSSLDKGGLDVGVDLRGCQTNKVWASIVGKINHLHSSGIVPLNSICFQVGDGSSIRFWKDTWLGEEPICIKYNRLFHLTNNNDCFVRQRIVNGSRDWDWSRPITMGRTKTEFDNLILDIASLESDEIVGCDSCIKNLSNDDTFLVNKVRKHIDECSLPMLSHALVGIR